jgi:hypothetical protein
MEILVEQQLVPLQVVVAEQAEQLLALLAGLVLTQIFLAQHSCMEVVVLDQTDLQVVHLPVAELIPSLQRQIEAGVAPSSHQEVDWQVPALPVL